MTAVGSRHTRDRPRLAGHSVRRVRRDWKLVRFLALTDAAAVALAAAAALLVTGSGSPSEGALWALLTLVATLLAFAFFRLYERDRNHISVSTVDEGADFVHALTLVGFAQLSLAELMRLGDLPHPTPVTVMTFWLVALGTLPLFRAAFRHGVVPLLDNPQNTVIIGAGEVGQAIARKIRKHREYNLRIVGFLDDEPHPLDPLLDDLPVLGGESALVATIRRYQVERIVLAFSRRSAEETLEVLRAAGLKQLKVSIVPRYFELMPTNVGVADVEGIPVLELPGAGLSRLAAVSKRAMDLALAVPGLVALAPLFLLVAAAIKLESRGPVFFRQPRMGRGQQVFRIYKFRTMVDGAEAMRGGLLAANESTGPLFKIRADPRVTRVGRFLRRLSLDELPQLINVVRGEMSLVGPRPFVVYEDEKINGWARERLDLTPGITGLWQVLGRNDIGFDEMVRLDYLYVNNWSLWWDVKLLLRTIPIVFARQGY